MIGYRTLHFSILLYHLLTLLTSIEEVGFYASTQDLSSCHRSFLRFLLLFAKSELLFLL